MHIGILEAALAAIDDEVYDPRALASVVLTSVTTDRLSFVMNDKPSPKTELDATPAESTAGAKPNPAFDSWLENKLHKMFDAVASEPLPADLVKLLEQLDQKTQKKDGKG